MIEIKVDASRALARFSPAGIPEDVRKNLRRTIPDLTLRFGQAVDRRLDSQLQSRTRIAVKKEMVENPTAIYGRVRVVWTGEASKAMVPQWLETGTRPHVIEAVRASVLAFFWPRIGGWFFGPKVNHPGTRPLFYMRDTMAEMSGEIRRALEAAVRAGMRGG